MKSAVLVSLMLHAGLVWADRQPGRSEDAGLPGEAMCGALLTEAECEQHRQKLVALADPAELIAYLDRHMAMLREREVMCGCTRERQVMARAQYR
jgi:hypothetical protein